MNIGPKLIINIMKEKKPNLIKLGHEKLMEQYNAMLAGKLVYALQKRGIEFDTKDDMDNYFKKHISAVNYEDGTTVYKLDGIDFCAAKRPKFTQGKKNIKIKFEFTVL